MKNKIKPNIIVIVLISVIIIGVISLIFININENKEENSVPIEDTYSKTDEYENKYILFSNERYGFAGSQQGNISYLMPYEPELNYSDSYSTLLKFKTKENKNVYLFGISTVDDNTTYTMTHDDIQKVSLEQRVSMSMLNLPINESTQWSSDFQKVENEDIEMDMEKTSGNIEDYKYSIYNVTNRYRNLQINVGIEIIVMSNELTEEEIDEVAQELIKTIK